jgi:CheY-like chemotaxis protein
LADFPLKSILGKGNGCCRQEGWSLAWERLLREG